MTYCSSWGLYRWVSLIMCTPLYLQDIRGDMLMHCSKSDHPHLQVSKAAADLMAYCDAHACDDPLITPVPTSENPFREKKFFCALLWDQSGIVVIKVQLYSMYMYVQCVHVLPIEIRHQCTIVTLHKSCRCTVHNNNKMSWN